MASTTDAHQTAPAMGEPRCDDAGDKRLMAALAAGENSALDELMLRWQRPLRLFVFRYMQNEADTDDLLQETFVRVFRHRTRYRPSSKFSTWLFTIAVNLCRNHAEKYARRRGPSLDDPGDAQQPAGEKHQPHTPEAGPDESLLRDERASAVRHAIAELPHDLRTAILLFEYDHLSHAEIAIVAETTPKAIETRLYRARHLLRDKLARFFSQ